MGNQKKLKKPTDRKKDGVAKSKVPRMGKPQKSRKHKIRSTTSQPLQDKDKGKQKNLEPGKDDDQWVPKKVKEMMWAKQQLNSGKKKKKSRFVGDTEKGVTRPLEKAPKFVQGKNESDHVFLERVNHETRMKMLQFKCKRQLKGKSEETDTKKGKIVKNETKPLGEGKRGKNRERKKKKTEALKYKKLEKQGDFAHYKDNVMFGEVVDQPPSLTAKPRKSAVNDSDKPGRKSLLLKKMFEGDDKNESDSDADVIQAAPKSLVSRPVGKTVKRKYLSFAQKRINDAEREKAIDMYRTLKAKKMKQNDELE